MQKQAQIHIIKQVEKKKKVSYMDKLLYHFKNNPYYSLWRMSEVTLSDKETYALFIKQTEYKANVWSGNFTYIWAHTNSDKLTVFKAYVDDMLVTFILTNSGRLYMPCLPFGKGNAKEVTEVLIKCAIFCLEWNNDTNFSHKSTVNPLNEAQLAFLKQYPQFNNYFREEKLTGIERHYSIPKLVSLYGKDYANIRNKINKFNKTYPKARLRFYKPKDYEEVIKLGEIWEETSGKKYKKIIDEFYFEPIIKHYKELGHIILVIELGGKIIGMISAEILPTGEAWGCITKFNKDYIGLSEKLTTEIAKVINQLNPNVNTINVGSDLGSKGLAFYKERYRPVLNYKRYALFFIY